jgi:hypothetical protein
MTRSPSPFLRAGLAALLLCPPITAVQAAAQVVSAAAAASDAASVSAVSGAASHAPAILGSGALQAPSSAVGLAPAPGFAPALVPSVVNAAPSAAADASAAPAAAPVARYRALTERRAAIERELRSDFLVHERATGIVGPYAELKSERSAIDGELSRLRSENPTVAHDAKGALARAWSRLTGAAPSLRSMESMPASDAGRAFDGTASRRAVDAIAPAAEDIASSKSASALAKSAPAASAPVRTTPPAAAPAVSGARRIGTSLAVKALIAAAILLATPGIALAATASAPVFTAAASLSLVASATPLASAVGAVAGAIYGMYAAKPKDGSAAPAGEVFASILRYGVLGGAGVYVLLNMTQLAFGGAAVGLQPVTSAVAVAALGRTAFQDKFMDPATSSADRVMGAFPAVAAAVGISVGMTMAALAAPPAALSLTLATSAMAATGVATALYAAIFKPGRSPIDGPARMAKGYVLQSLMMGLALAMTNPYLFWAFAAMGTAGFGLVLWTTALEAWAHRPGAPAQPLPPAPPVTPAPAPAPAPKV